LAVRSDPIKVECRDDVFRCESTERIERELCFVKTLLKVFSDFAVCPLLDSSFLLDVSYLNQSLLDRLRFRLS
jgi:hypothetical protein